MKFQGRYILVTLLTNRAVCQRNVSDISHSKRTLISLCRLSILITSRLWQSCQLAIGRCRFLSIPIVSTFQLGNSFNQLESKADKCMRHSALAFVLVCFPSVSWAVSLSSLKSVSRVSRGHANLARLPSPNQAFVSFYLFSWGLLTLDANGRWTLEVPGVC